MYILDLINEWDQIINAWIQSCSILTKAFDYIGLLLGNKMDAKIQGWPDFVICFVSISVVVTDGRRGGGDR